MAWLGYQATPWTELWPPLDLIEVQVLQVLIFHKNFLGPFEFSKVHEIQKYVKRDFHVCRFIIQKGFYKKIPQIIIKHNYNHLRKYIMMEYAK
jgi:hypothetical protein